MMDPLSKLKVIKVKRKLNDESLPDMLVLDHVVSSKRCKRITGIYEKVTEFQEVEALTNVPLAKIQSSPLEALNQLRVNNVAGSDLGASSSDVSLSEEVFEFYLLKDLEEPSSVPVDLTDVCRVIIPAEELILLDNSSAEEDDVYSEDDSNAEDYYRNEYPDETDGSEDFFDDDSDSCGSFHVKRDYGSSDEDGSSRYRRYESENDDDF